MKTYSLSIVLSCFLCVAAYAQSATLSANTDALFSNVSSKLTASEKNNIATLSGFTLNAKDQRLYRDTADLPFDVDVFVLDLTNDGVEEIGMVYRPMGSADQKDISSMLFVKDKAGDYKLNLNESGEFYFLNMNDLVFPDIYVRNTTIGLPTYRWNGNNYIKHTFLNAKKLKRYVVSSFIQAQNRYTGSQVGE